MRFVGLLLISDAQKMTASRRHRLWCSHREQLSWRWEWWFLILSLVTISASSTERKVLPFVRLRQQQHNVRTTESHDQHSTWSPTERDSSSSFTLQNLKSRGGSAAITGPVFVATGTACTASLNQSVRVALAGGIAGAVGTALLYPMDAAKT